MAMALAHAQEVLYQGPLKGILISQLFYSDHQLSGELSSSDQPLCDISEKRIF